jgi:protein bicaudal C
LKSSFQGSLPIALIFDYPENSVDSEHITKLMYSHDVFITVRQKSRQSTLCIVVKGIEKFIGNIYEARHQLLNLTSPRIQAEIPATYLAPNEKSKTSNCVSALLASGAAQTPFSPLSPINPIPFLKWPTPMPQNEFQQLQNLRHQMSQLALPGTTGFVGQSSKIQAAASNLFHQHIQQQQQQQHQHKSFPFANNNNNMNSRNSGHNHNFQLRQPMQQPNLQLPLPSHLLSPKNTSDIHSSGYQSMNCSTNSLDQQHQSSSSTSSIIHTSPDTTTATTSTTGVGGGGGGENMSHQSGNRNMSYGDSPTYNNGNNSHMNETNETRSPIQQQQQQQQQQNQLQHQHQQRHHNDVPKVKQPIVYII